MFDAPMNRISLFSNHFPVLPLAVVLLFSCAPRHGPLTEKDSAIIRDSVVALTAAIARDLSANGPAVWLNYFDDAPGFTALRVAVVSA